MPEMDGLQFTKLIQATQENWKNSLMQDRDINRAVKGRNMCPVVAITACNDKSIEDSAKLAGVSKVLYKPIDFRILKTTLNNYYFKSEASI